MKWSKENLNAIVRTYQLGSVIGSLDFSRSLFIVYLMALGFTGQQTGILQALLFWTSFVLELPTGLFADRYGRKSSVIIGYGSMALTFLVLTQVQSFPLAVIAFVLWGISFSFLSGANSALLYDGLQEAKSLDKHIHILGRVRSLGTLGMAGAIAAGGWFYEWNATSIFWVSGFCALIGLVLFLRVPEPRLHEENVRPPILPALREFLGSPSGRNLLIFMLAIGCIEMVHTPFFIFSQVFFKSDGWSERAISIILSLGFLVSALTQAIAPKLRRFSVFQLTAATILVLVISLITLWVSKSIWLHVGLFLLVNGVPYLLFVHTDQYVQDQCVSNIRASLLSVHSFFNAILIGVGYIFIGFTSDRMGMSLSLVSLSVPLFIGLALSVWHSSRRTYETASVS